MRRRLARAVDDTAVAAFARYARTSFVLSGEGWRLRVAVDRGRPEIDADARDDLGSAVDFSLSAPDPLWHDLLSDAPPPGRHSLVHLVRTGDMTLSGSRLAYDRNIHLVRAMIDAARTPRSAGNDARALDAVGSYHRLTTALGTSDIYVERAGTGMPLLAFATAGSDTGQWHGMITHTDLTASYELITVDMPWHGKSTPSWGDPVGSYALTPETYTEFIIAVCDALDLERPILVGVSMGGAAVVHAVATHPARFAGAVSCQAAASVRARAHEHLRGTKANASLFVPEWTYGLMNPASPREFLQRVWWGYSSGGYGLYAADIDSYLRWDFSTVKDLLTPDSPHIAVLSGSFDTSVPPERSRALAAQIPNSSFQEMPELGHFPHAENPAVFVRYLLPAVERVLRS